MHSALINKSLNSSTGWFVLVIWGISYSRYHLCNTKGLTSAWRPQYVRSGSHPSIVWSCFLPCPQVDPGHIISIFPRYVFSPSTTWWHGHRWSSGCTCIRRCGTFAQTPHCALSHPIIPSAIPISHEKNFALRVLLLCKNMRWSRVIHCSFQSRSATASYSLPFHQQMCMWLDVTWVTWFRN